MRILIEECRYDPKVLEGVLPRDRLLLTDEKVKVEHVGYFRSAECDDFVFFLPKVVLEPKVIDGEKVDRVFCTAARPLGFSPEALIDPETAVAEDGHGLEERERGNGISSTSSRSGFTAPSRVSTRRTQDPTPSGVGGKGSRAGSAAGT